MSDVAARLAGIHDRIAVAARGAGRAPEEITLVAVSKEVDADAVSEAAAAGQRDFGENRAQELVAKTEALGALNPSDLDLAWHFIGRLQRNKVKAIASRVALWHSVDRADLGAEIARHAPGARVLAQVNISGEEQKGGCPPGEVERLIAALTDLGLSADGLMTVPPLIGDVWPHFAALADLAQRLDFSVDRPVLSMGMSNDFEAAVAEGSTLVRVGRVVFAP